MIAENGLVGRYPGFLLPLGSKLKKVSIVFRDCKISTAGLELVGIVHRRAG